MVIAFSVAIAAAQLARPGLESVGGLRPDRVPAILAGASVLVAVGLLDDVFGMRARVKLLAQVGAAVLAWYLGLSIEALHLPWTSADLGVLALPMTVTWIVAVINAINLIDGLDGLASGVVLTALGAFAVIAGAERIDPTLVIIAATTAAAVGFLAYNLHPASIIMGDTGSMFLGFVVAAVAISLTQDGVRPAPPWVPVVALALPIVDTCWAIVRRTASGDPIFVADRNHIHHQLLRKGMSQRDAMLLLTAVSAGAAILAILLSRGN